MLLDLVELFLGFLDQSILLLLHSLVLISNHFLFLCFNLQGLLLPSFVCLMHFGLHFLEELLFLFVSMLSLFFNLLLITSCIMDSDHEFLFGMDLPLMESGGELLVDLIFYLLGVLPLLGDMNWLGVMVAIVPVCLQCLLLFIHWIELRQHLIMLGLYPCSLLFLPFFLFLLILGHVFHV